MKKILISLGILIILAVGVFFSRPQTNEKLPVSGVVKTEEGKEIEVRIADSVEERELGLSYFKSLPQDQGMLFLFDKPGIYPFWMKGMKLPLDIIWLKSIGNGEYKIVYTATDVSPESYPQSINPYLSSDAVLEVNKGITSVYNLVPEKNLWITFKK